MKSAKILVSSDGPDCNVIKLKPPMVFTKENVDTFIKVFDKILEESSKRFEEEENTKTIPTEYKKSTTLNHTSHNKPQSEIRIKSI